MHSDIYRYIFQHSVSLQSIISLSKELGEAEKQRSQMVISYYKQFYENGKFYPTSQTKHNHRNARIIRKLHANNGLTWQQLKRYSQTWFHDFDFVQNSHWHHKLD